jgi:nucleotide-binding universal stress UspA family protein
MSFEKILVAVEESPIAAHAVDVAIDLARSLKAEIAFRVALPPISYPTDAGILANEVMVQAKLEDRRVLASVRERLSLPASVQEFLPVGDPATEIAAAKIPRALRGARSQKVLRAVRPLLQGDRSARY